MNLNRLKSIFTPKRVAIFFMSISCIVIFFSGGSFQFLNPQYYIFQYLMKTKSGFYILDEKLYEETKDRQFVLLPNGEYSLGLSSVGDEIFYRYEEYDFEKISSGVFSCKQHKRYYIDSSGTEHIISFELKFRYIDYGIFFNGDEAGGVRLSFKKISAFLAKNTIYTGEQNDK